MTMRFWWIVMIFCVVSFWPSLISAQEPAKPKVLKTRSQRGIDSLKLNSSGSILASLDDAGVIRIWDLKAERVNASVNNDRKLDIQLIALHPTKNLLASAEHNGCIRLWNLPTEKQVQLIRKAGSDGKRISALAFRPDGKQMLYADSDIVLANVRASSPPIKIDRIIGESIFARYSPDGKWIAFREGFRPGAIVLWDTSTEKIHSTVPLEGVGFLKDVIIAPDKKSLFIHWSSFSKKVIHWDLDKRKVIRSYAIDPKSMALSHNGKWLALTDRDELGAIYLHDAATGKMLKKLTGNTKLDVASMTFTPDDARLFAAIGRQIYIWDVRKTLAKHVNE